jgi:hypothetical protein
VATPGPELAEEVVPSSKQWPRAAPIATLLLLSPIITNVLFGSIRASFILAVLPAVSAWGLGSLIIREVVRRRRQGWAAILLLGVALALAEECVFLQTALLPLIGVDRDHVYGRAFGVNWPYLLWALGYESVWAVALPILFVEWMYPNRREEPWLSGRGLAIACVIFMAAGVVRWYGWTQVFVPQNFPQWAHRPSPLTIVTALAVIGLLLVSVFHSATPAEPKRLASGPVPRPWLVGLNALLLGLTWFVLLFLAYGAAPELPVAIPLLAGAGVAGAAGLVVNRYVRRPGWRRLHSLALAFGALLASISAGYLVLKGAGASPFDFVAKALLNLIAILLLVRLGWNFARDPIGDRAAVGSPAPGLMNSGAIP